MKTILVSTPTMSHLDRAKPGISVRQHGGDESKAEEVNHGKI